MEITKDTRIGELLAQQPELAEVLALCGMHCFSCPAAMAETLEEASAVHGIEVGEVLEAIADYREEHGQQA